MRKSNSLMNQRISNRSIILAIALLCAVASSSSMTLGKARGVVLLGQPLKLTVPIQWDAGQSLSAQCFDAEVFYGDIRQAGSRISVSSDYSQHTQSANVYVTSTSHVDEPVVTVYLRAGCEAKATRRFVLLADLATVAVTPTERLSLVAESATVEPSLHAQTTAGARVAFPSQTGKQALPVHDRVQTLSAPVRPAPKVGVVRPPLKWLPVDLIQDRDPTLKLSIELYLGDGEDLQKRAEAAALWKSLNSTPQDILVADKRRQSMEADFKGLQDLTGKNSQTLLELNGQLQTAESQRYLNPLVYGLAGIALIFWFGLAYVLFTGRPVVLARVPWWRTEDISDNSSASVASNNGEDISAPDPSGRTHVLDTHQQAVIEPTVGEATGVTEVDIDLQLEEPSGRIERETAPFALSAYSNTALNATTGATGQADFAHSSAASLRAVNTQEMFDVRQQADFFMTLGQHDEALRLLKNCVDGNFDSNPLVYLDLLKVLHTLGRKVEFDNYRTGFNALFSGHVPVYAEFSQGGKGLEAYPEICRSIEALWPSEQAVGYIEKCLLREVGDGTTRGMDLEAFRELLMLHGTAKRIDSSSESKLMPFIAAKTTPSELEAVYAPGLDDFNLNGKTRPIAVADMDLGDVSVDLELHERQGNLIDFDPSDLSFPDPGQPRKS
jgi:hypothetical protein